MKKKIKINQNYAALKEEIEQCIADFDNSGITIFKGRNTLKSFALSDGTEIVIKRFGRLIWLRKLIYSTICSPKAKRAYDYGMRFLKLGFETPEPVAHCEKYERGLLADSYFVSLRSEATPAFKQLVESERFDTVLAERVAGLMANLHNSGAVHGDPNLNNILFYTDKKDILHLSLIDTNRSYFKKRLGRRESLRNLMRVTHRRDLMREIAGRYATLRGYDPIKTVDYVFRHLEKFEQNRRLRHKVKNLLRSKKS